MLSVTRLVLPLVLLLYSRQVALACASCGSGGDDPLILYPNQDWRFYLGASRSWGFKTVKANGQIGSEASPRFKDSLVFAAGKAIREDAFVTLTVPYLQNWRNGKYKRSFGDPLLAMRWTLISQNIANLYIPQLQLMLAKRFATAKPVQEAEDAFRLDVFGAGVNETKIGLDLFQGMADFKWGGAHAFLFPEERNIAGAAFDPGLGQRSVLTVGYGKNDLGKFLFGLTKETRDKIRINGSRIAKSEKQENGFFVTADLQIDQMQMLRTTFAQKATIGKNSNASRNNSLVLAYQLALAP